MTAPSAQASSDPRPADSPRVDVTTLTPISEALGEDKSPKDILRLIVKAAHSVTRANTASLMLVDHDSGVLRVEVAEGFKGRKIYSTRLKIGQGVTGWVAEAGVPLRLGNVTKDERYVRVQKDLRSELAVPLKIRGKVIGVISVDSTKVNQFTAEDEALLLSMAAQSARVIQTTRLHQETKRRNQALRLLIDSGNMLAGSLKLQDILTKLSELAAEFWKAPVSGVYLAKYDEHVLALEAAYGASGAFRAQDPQPLSDNLLAQVLNGEDEATFVEDLKTELRDNTRSVILAEDLRSILAVPLIAKNRRLGVLAVYFRRGRSVSDNDRELMVGLAHAAALAIDNAHAHGRMMETEDALRRAEKSSLLAEMAGALSHEIRNPLTSMKLLFEALVRSKSIAPESTEDANMIQRQIERLEQIVETYLDTARAHATEPELRLLDLNEVVDESLLLLASNAQEGTRLVCKLHRHALPLHGDATQLSQAIYNLVLNAIQAVGQQENDVRGRIDISTGSEHDRGRRVFFEVSDDGPGLSQKVKDNMFQPFVTTKKQGVGLGLSIVKRIVESHGGELMAESPRADLGHGARFRITMPGIE